MSKRPNLFIVGAAKAGTTTLQTLLSNHPDVFMSPIKEPNFFCKDIDPGNFGPEWQRRFTEDQGWHDSEGRIIPRHQWYVRDESDYLSLFSEAGRETIVGEASVSYLYSSVAAQQIRAFSPDAKIIMILRNPVDRAFSHFLMDVKTGNADPNEDAVAAIRKDFGKPDRKWGREHLYVDLGLYYEQVKRYLDCFPREQVLAHFFDSLKSSPQETYASTFSFLGLANDPAATIPREENRASYPRSRISSMLLRSSGLKKSLARCVPERWKRGAKAMLLSEAATPKLTQAQRIELMIFFKSDITQLEDLIRRDLSSWVQ